jgi:D-serine deaminase-like pyridoxal phosphate-dependent protein
MADNMNRKTYQSDAWYTIANADDVSSPALLIYPDRIEKNIKRMISMVQDPNMLRPHVKTHKIPEIIRMQIKLGISKFKCATIAEAEMTAECGADDILLAYQPVGPGIRRFFSLIKKFPQTKISCIADCETIVRQLSENATINNLSASVWLDINNGMNRTGIAPGPDAFELYKLIAGMSILRAEGLHVYDGHIHDTDPSVRENASNSAFIPVLSLISLLKSAGFTQIKVVAGGTPAFPIHAKRTGVETSPGTTLLWDYGYSSSFHDLDFVHAAVLFTSVISKPAEDLICIDLGHKAVSSEMPQPRIFIPDLDNYEIVSHNEEHMVIRTSGTENLKVGDILYCIPYHICPTVDRYDKVTVVRGGRAAEQWNVEARKREITV